VTLKSFYQLNDRALCRQIDDEAVVLDLDSGVYYGLNATGTRVWQLLEQHLPVSQMGDRLLEEFEVDSQCLQADLQELLGDLLAKGLLIETQGEADVEPTA
jgi:hypothetical protein